MRRRRRRLGPDEAAAVWVLPRGVIVEVNAPRDRLHSAFGPADEEPLYVPGGRDPAVLGEAVRAGVTRGSAPRLGKRPPEALAAIAGLSSFAYFKRRAALVWVQRSGDEMKIYSNSRIRGGWEMDLPPRTLSVRDATDVDIGTAVLGAG